MSEPTLPSRLLRRGPARAEQARRPGVPTKGGAKIREHRLDNGMRVLTIERHTDPVVAVMTWYRVGSRNEREHEAGVSHFLEHMMFKGSKRFAKGEVDRVTTQLGGSNNAFTSYDHTAYWFELASDRWEQALEIEADRMGRLTLDEGEYRSEREVVLEELAMGLDDPWRRLADRVGAALFTRHPYRRPIIGHADALRALDVAGMRDYYERFYHPGNATLVLAGDIEPKRALAAVERRFGRMRPGMDYERADCFRPELELPGGEQRLTMDWDDQGRRLMIAFQTAPVGSDDDWALDVASALLSLGRNSRLHRRLVIEEGLATSVMTQNDSRVDGGVLWLFAECAQGAAPARLEAAVDEELARLCDERVGASEMSRVRSMLVASEAQESETVSDLAEDLGSFAVDADWRMSVEAVERIQAVTAARVQDMARRLLVPARRVVGWCLPRAARPAAVAGEGAPTKGKAHKRRAAKKSGKRAAKKKPKRVAKETGKRAAKKAARRPAKAAGRRRAS